MTGLITPSSEPARGVIADSWRRARLSGLLPSSTVDALKPDDFDTSSRLLRAANPVLDRMAAALDGWDYCVMLADRDARIVATRWGCARMICATGYRPNLAELVGHLGVLTPQGLPTAQASTPAAAGLYFHGLLSRPSLIGYVAKQSRTLARRVGGNG